MKELLFPSLNFRGFIILELSIILFTIKLFAL